MVYEHLKMGFYAKDTRPNILSYSMVSLKLLVSHIAVSRGETLPGPNGFSKTPNSSYLSCCNSWALNSSSPSKASARCWYDEVSNLRCLDSDDPRLEASAAVGFRSEESLPLSPSTRKIWIVHLSLVIERSP